jgi:hypothetical protein
VVFLAGRAARAAFLPFRLARLAMASVLSEP